MWALRELSRLVGRVFVAVVFAVVVAEILTALSTNSASHELQICLIAIGAITIALGAMGGGSAYQRYADTRTRWQVGALTGFLPPARANEPHLAPGAVLFISGAIVLALGFLV